MAGVTDDWKSKSALYIGSYQQMYTPFEIGQDIKDIYRFTIVGSEIDVDD